MAQCVPGRIQDAAGATTEGQRVEWRGGTALMGCTAWLRGWLRLRIGRGHAMAPARGQRRGGGGGRLRVCKPPPSLAREGRAADSPAGQFDGLRRTHPLCAVSSSSPGSGSKVRGSKIHADTACRVPLRDAPSAAVAASLSREGAVNADRSPRHIVAPPLQENPAALLCALRRPRRRAPAATCCPEPRLCRLKPANERWSTRFA